MMARRRVFKLTAVEGGEKVEPRKMLVLAGIAFFASACPVTPEEQGQAVGGPTAGSPNGGPRGGGGDGKPAASSGVELAKLVPQQTQEQVAEGDHVKVSGTIGGDCTGMLRLDVIEVQKMEGGRQGGASANEGPLTVIQLSAPGPFDGVMPKGKRVMISALCDQNNDGKISAPTDNIAFGTDLGVVDSDHTDIKLELKPFPTTGPGGRGGGKGGAEAGGMGGPGGGGAGGPPSGGPGGQGGQGMGGPGGQGGQGMGGPGGQGGQGMGGPGGQGGQGMGGPGGQGMGGPGGQGGQGKGGPGGQGGQGGQGMGGPGGPGMGQPGSPKEGGPPRDGPPPSNP
jgi:hypothetical protein